MESWSDAVFQDSITPTLHHSNTLHDLLFHSKKLQPHAFRPFEKTHSAAVR